MENIENKTDLRVIKTQAAIRKAFLDLLKEKPFDKIMVSEITKAAMINRSTFYLHYRDKYDLMECLENEIIERLKQFYDLLTPEAIHACQKGERPFPHLVPMLQFVRENIILFQSILRRGNGEYFFKKISNIFFHKAQRHFNLNLNDEFKDYRVDIAISAMSTTLSHWVNEESDIDTEHLASYLTRVLWSVLLTD